MAAIAVATASPSVLHVPEAKAAKVRKKPPLKPLAPPVVDPDAWTETEDATDESTHESTKKVPVQATPSEPPRPDPTPSIPYVRSRLVCLYGEQTDASTKQTRCLAPEELTPPRLVIVNSRPLAEQLGMLGNTTDLMAPEATVEEPPEESLPEPESPFQARVVRVSFENGAVSGALRNLRAHTDDMAKCVEENGGLRADSARLRLLFFVRGNQKASGMIVASARNIPVPVVRCIRKIIEEGTVGRPSSDAVGVTLLLELKNR